MNKDDKKIFVVLTIILSLMVVILSSYLIYDKVINKDKKENNNVVDKNNDDSNNDTEQGIFGQILNSSIGKFVIDKTGLVYYSPYDSVNLHGSEYKLNFKEEDKNKLGKYGTHEVDIELYPGNSDKDIIEGYKLDLTNIKSAYEIEVGNGGSSISIYLLTNDGKVNQVSFTAFSTNDNSIEVKKNIEGYENIVSIVQNSSFGGNSPIFIDKDGNEYR